MKYGILSEFKEYLDQKHTKNTAKRYYSAVNTLFKEVQFDSLEEIPEGYIENKLSSLKNKNEVSAVKNGLLNLFEMDNSLVLPDQDLFSQVSKKKRNTRKNKGEVIDLDQVRRKVNQIRDEKIRLAYRLAMISGARVSELANLEKQNIMFQDGKILVNIIDGKGGKSGIVECIPDEYVYKNLQHYVEKMDSEEKIFYSESYMREKAWKLGLEMHDFRRISAVLLKKRLMNEGSNVYEANGKVMEFLRHDRFETTKRYLYGKKIKIKKG